jgi:hypothetical protein
MQKNIGAAPHSLHAISTHVEVSFVILENRADIGLIVHLPGVQAQSLCRWNIPLHWSWSMPATLAPDAAVVVCSISKNRTLETYSGMWFAVPIN